MKNGGKNKSVAFIILVSVVQICVAKANVFVFVFFFGNYGYKNTYKIILYYLIRQTSVKICNIGSCGSKIIYI